jgi:hypothetical protein
MEGVYAKPRRGENALYLVGARVLGTPGSPGTSQPSGAPGKTTDCSPGIMVSVLFCVSYQGMLISYRKP